MKQETIYTFGTALLGALVGAILVLALGAASTPDSLFSERSSPRVSNGLGMGGGGGMMRGPHGSMMGSMLVTSEREFIEQMIPHHEEAIETAGEVLERGGTTPGMVTLAENIIASQTEEVALMKESYEAWYGQPYQPTGEYEPMMRELADYDGATLDRVFLHDMTMHHMGAIMMARSLQPYLEHDVMRELTQTIIVNQSREIETMQRLLAEMNQS